MKPVPYSPVGCRFVDGFGGGVGGGASLIIAWDVPEEVAAAGESGDPLVVAAGWCNGMDDIEWKCNGYWDV